MDSVQTFLQEYIHEHIPITQDMAIAVQTVTPQSITVTAQLAPNINHRQSAFGGSISTLAILAGWILLKHRSRGMSPAPTLVIQESTTKFLKPITADYSAYVTNTDAAALEKFDRTYQRHGKARLLLKSQVDCDGECCAVHEGLFVAIARPQA